MPDFRRLICLLMGGLLLALAGRAQAHQVPVMQIEAEFFLNESYTLRINLDPRVFLSDQPSSLPLVPASWYREQTPEQMKQTEQQLLDYLHKNVQLHFDAQKVPLPDLTIVALDGANNEPVTDETEEVHLLATGHGGMPSASQNFSVLLGREAGVSLILVSTLEGQAEPRLRVIFPGETSEAFSLTGPSAPSPKALPAPIKVTAQALLKEQQYAWMWRGGIAVVLLIFYNVFLKKQRKSNLLKGRRRR